MRTSQAAMHDAWRRIEPGFYVRGRHAVINDNGGFVGGTGLVVDKWGLFVMDDPSNPVRSHRRCIDHYATKREAQEAASA